MSNLSEPQVDNAANSEATIVILPQPNELKRSVGAAELNEVGKPQQRRKLKPDNFSLPANDIRSSYPRIYASIFNGCCTTTATKQFKSICIEECVLVVRSMNHPFGPNYREVRGIRSMVDFIDSAMEAVPDCIFNIIDTKFYRKPQHESAIISSYTINGKTYTTILDFQPTAAQTASLTNWSPNAYVYRVRAVWTSPAKTLPVVDESPCTALW